MAKPSDSGIFASCPDKPDLINSVSYGMDQDKGNRTACASLQRQTQYYIYVHGSIRTGLLPGRP